MTWLAPWALAVAGGAAAIVGLLHLLARDRPSRWLLPTARFVRAGTARATRRARTPRDRALLALRVLALLLAGAGFAGPVREPAGGSIARVVLLEVPSGGAESALAVRAARERMEPGDRLVLLDTMATAVAVGRETGTLDSLARTTAADSAPRASGAVLLSAGFVAAMRTAGDVAAQVDSVALIVVSPLRGVEDAALRDVRALWPGRIEIVQIPSAAGDTLARPVHVRGPADDPVVAGMRLAGAAPAPGRIATRATLVVRDALAAADSAFARDGGTLVAWRSAPPRSSAERTSQAADTVGGIVVGDAVIPFAAARRVPPPAGAVVGRWVDGAPAITEAPLGAGCIRTVAVEIPSAGDLTLRPAFQAALRGIAAPCGGVARPVAAEPLRTALAGTGPLASASALRRAAARAPATPWLLGAALVLLLLEPLLRRAARPAAPAGMEAA